MRFVSFLLVIDPGGFALASAAFPHQDRYRRCPGLNVRPSGSRDIAGELKSVLSEQRGNFIRGLMFIKG
ncbi:hypothetical protein GRH90_04960 [Enterobacteriales bacterium SAP-6]|uniref:Uncharacterized protein n=1 Tax=Acerihabitans arboris TaxID=2691583 RepID=A0A845SLD2_9GAMM|nr:hypothetical protein [Acerihabitans arboris]